MNHFNKNLMGLMIGTLMLVSSAQAQCVIAGYISGKEWMGFAGTNIISVTFSSLGIAPGMGVESNTVVSYGEIVPSTWLGTIIPSATGMVFTPSLINFRWGLVHRDTTLPDTFKVVDTMRPELFLYWNLSSVLINSSQQLRLAVQDNSHVVKTFTSAITYNNGTNWKNIGDSTKPYPYFIARDTSNILSRDTLNLADTIFNQLAAFCKIRVIATDLDGNSDTAFTQIFSITTESSVILFKKVPQCSFQKNVGQSYDLLGRRSLGFSAKICIIKNATQPVLKLRK